MNDWRSELGDMFSLQQKRDIEIEKANFSKFLNNVVRPAFEQLAPELRKYGRTAVIKDTDAALTLTVSKIPQETAPADELAEMNTEIDFCIIRRELPSIIMPVASVTMQERNSQRISSREVELITDKSRYSINDVHEEDIIKMFLKCYRTVCVDDSDIL